MLLKQVTPTIHCRIIKTARYWRIYVRDEYYVINVVDYVFPEGAFRRKDFELQAAYWRIRSREIIPTVNVRTLTPKEHSFINKLIRSNCVGMSQKMYGYLKGIQERNPLNDSASES